MNYFEIIILSFSVQAIVLFFIFLLKKNGDKFANILWAIFLLLFAYNIFYNVLYWTDFDIDLKRRLALLYFIPMSLYGPLFYLYIERLVLKKNKPLKYILYHFIPLIVIIVLYIRLYLLPLKLRDILIEQGQFEKSVILVNPQYVFSLLVLIMLTYAIITYIRFRKVFKHCMNFKHWLRSITICFLLFSFAWLIYDILSYSGYLTKEYDYYITILMIVFIVLTSFFAHLYPQINMNNSLTQIFTNTQKYSTTGLSQGVSMEYKEKLLQLMYEQKPFLNADLQLADLVKLLGLSRHHTSQVINEHFEMGFYDFINSFRVEEAKNLLLEDNRDKMKIIQVAYKSGFNNKVSFYKAFKKFIGSTPSEYIKNSTA